MASESKLLDDIARVAGGAVSVLSSLRQQMRADLRDRMDNLGAQMDFAQRDEIDRLKLMLEKSRQEQDFLKQRIASLEEMLQPAAPKSKKVARKKVAPKKATPKTAKKPVNKKSSSAPKKSKKK